jgi:D-inositol-3-phosphate glycosyltransferase
MISFVWSAKYPFLAGVGGSENYTAGHIRELMRRGIPCRILTLGHGEDDGRRDFPDIPFKTLNSKEELSELDDTIVFVTYPLNVKTKHKSYCILHCPPLTCGTTDPLFDRRGVKGKKLITTSRFASRMWLELFGTKAMRVPVVYPFADPAFARINRTPAKTKKVRILFAGRLMPDKGIYTLLAAMHMRGMRNLEYELTMTTSGDHTEDGKIIKALIKAHPRIRLTHARTSPQKVAELMAEHDIVVMPSTRLFWQEIFGIVSVEAQHAGCRVVASRAGGLPETNCGGLILTKPDDPVALADAIGKAVALGPLTARERKAACAKFTLQASVDSLVKHLGGDVKLLQHTAGTVPVLLPPLQPRYLLSRLRQSAFGGRQING